ncbi:unnamed protein product [Allacma fusca]|uniref:18S rRNA (guanine-N(7))-methyltransferase n=1 Tax=Allacma fusca TaxID=39272 RepID=A0A8J2LU87_9HEXA|nr:unnamed protein product [Allacma fusca]
MSFGKRPELTAPPEFFYNEDEARKYSQNSRMMEIQGEMAERAIELLELPEDESKLILDIGCGSGLSGAALEEAGHYWVGMDISDAMLNVARDREVEGDLILSDMGQGVPFRPGSFDGAISISALQWLCNADKRTHKPVQRLYRFFSSLYGVLDNGSRAVFQFYPADQGQTDLIMQQAKRAGFNGGLVIDFPESSKAKKYYLVLVVGGKSNPIMPQPLTNIHSNSVEYTERPQDRRRALAGGKTKSVKDWIQDKKDRRRRQGKDTKHDSKYTGRKRSSKF